MLPRAEHPGAEAKGGRENLSAVRVCRSTSEGGDAVTDVSDEVLTELAGAVAAAIPQVLARIPPTPAAELGRLRAIADGDDRVAGGLFAGAADALRLVAAGPRAARLVAGHVDPPHVDVGGDAAAVREALSSLPPLLIERLLGALELTVPKLDLPGAPELISHLPPFTGGFALVRVSGQSEALTQAGMVEQLRPGAQDLVGALTRRLAAVPQVAAQLTVAPEVTDEQDIAAAHGAAHLALAVATAAAVLPGVGVPPWARTPPAVVGVAIGTAVSLLRETAMPDGYAAALLARVRAEYLTPRHTSGWAPVSGHLFALREGTGLPTVDVGGNGLVAVVPDGVVIRTGVESGQVHVAVSVLDAPPPEVDALWDEVVEVSWQAAAGSASVVGSAPGDPHLRHVTPPWPGDYRLRVHARGRDDFDVFGSESYELVVWPAPAASEVVHARSDRLGSRLRGEPPPPERPEHAYRWVRRLLSGATITVVTGTSFADVLRAFGADPARPESSQAIGEELARRRSIDPWVMVLDVGDAVLAVEPDGWQGSTPAVLTRASAGGRAASMYWNVVGDKAMSFAERGDVLLSTEPFGNPGGPAPVVEALTGLDFADLRRGKELMGLVAVQRFTGRGITAEDLARMQDADIAFRIVPHLPPLYPHQPRWESSLGPVTEALTGMSEPALRDLAWWVAAEAARYAGIDADPDIVASLAARALTADAHLRARRSQLDSGEHRQVWLALHAATNPDPIAAVTNTADAARYAADPHGDVLLADARARIAPR